MAAIPDDGPTPLEYHVLLAVARGPRYGYAIRDAVEEESEGALSPRAGTLYRVIARLLSDGLVRETDAPDPGSHPGRPRRYYELTAAGRGVLSEETRRLKIVAELARERLRAGRP